MDDLVAGPAWIHTWVEEDENAKGTFYVLFDCSNLACASRPVLAPVTFALNGQPGVGGLARSGFMNALGARWDGWCASFSFPLPTTPAALLFTATFEDGTTAEYIMTKKAVSNLFKQAREREKLWAWRAKEAGKLAKELGR